MRTSHSYKTEAIILARRNIGEADRLLTVFTKYHGKLKVIAKGIRRPTSRKRGSLEIFSRSLLFLIKGKTFDIITEVQILDSFNGWRGDLLRVGVAYHCAEVVNKLTREGQESRGVYELLGRMYRTLNTVEFWQIHDHLTDFKRQLLEELGFLARGKETPDIDGYIEELSQSKLKTKRFLHSLVNP